MSQIFVILRHDHYTINNFSKTNYLRSLVWLRSTQCPEGLEAFSYCVNVCEWHELNLTVLIVFWNGQKKFLDNIQFQWWNWNYLQWNQMENTFRRFNSFITWPCKHLEITYIYHFMQFNKWTRRPVNYMVQYLHFSAL